MSGPKPIRPAKPEMVRRVIHDLTPLQHAYVVQAVVEALIAERAQFLAAGSIEAVDAMEQLLGLFKLAANQAVRM